MTIEISGGDIRFTVAVPERADWPLDGNDTLIVSVPTPLVISEEKLKAHLLGLSERSALDLGTLLHHADFVITSSPATVGEWGIMPEHRDCPACTTGLAATLDALARDPKMVLAVGQLHWSPRP